MAGGGGGEGIATIWKRQRADFKFQSNVVSISV